MKNSCFWHKKPFLIFLAQVRSKWISESCSTAFLAPLCKNLWGVHLFFFSLSFLQPGILTDKRNIHVAGDWAGALWCSRIVRICKILDIFTIWFDQQIQQTDRPSDQVISTMRLKPIPDKINIKLNRELPKGNHHEMSWDGQNSKSRIFSNQVGSMWAWH